MQIVIGRTGDQPFPINDGYVSRRHAIFYYDEATRAMTLIDQSGPGKGTFVQMGNQFQQISQCNVEPSTTVRLGPYFTFKVGQLFQKPAQKPVSPPPAPKLKVDISHLRQVSENYEQTKLDLEQKQANINSLRTMSLVGSLAGSAITGILTTMLGEEWKLVAGIGGVSISILFLISLTIYCSRATKSILHKKTQNERYYKLSYHCPKCTNSYVGKIYENVLAEGKCPKCKAEYYDAKM